MTKKELFRKAVKIVCLQQGIKQKDLAKRLGISLDNLKSTFTNKYNPYQSQVARYVYDHLDPTNVSVRVHCVLNDITLKKFCDMNDINYYSFSTSHMSTEQIDEI